MTMVPKTFQIELERITDSIRKKGNEVNAFSDYLKNICALPNSSFSTQNWPAAWRQSVYRFGELFRKTDAGPYLLEFVGPLDPGAKEIAAFIHSEIIWNYYEEDNEYNGELLREYVKKFTHNPEFHNTYGHFLLRNKNYSKAIFEYQRALKIDPGNFNFVSSYMGAIKVWFEHELDRNTDFPKTSETLGKLLQDAQLYLKETGVWSIPALGSRVRDTLLSLSDRLRDLNTVHKKIESFKREFEHAVQIEQRRLIEVLGIFSAILAFIITNVSIALNALSIKDALYLMLGMGIVLLIFSIGISYLFARKLKYPPKFYPIMRLKFFALMGLFLAIIIMWATI